MTLINAFGKYKPLVKSYGQEMQRKRFKVVKENEGIMPLYSRSTNVRVPPAEPLDKPTQSLKRASSESSTSTKRRKREKQTTPTEACSTVFDNDNVQLRFLGKEELLTRVPSPPQRLTKIDEEGYSLQLDDFDQPPESTSTPVLSPRASQEPHYSFEPQMFYNPSMDDSPLQNIHYENQIYPYVNYVPIGFVPQYPLQPVAQMGCPRPMGPSMNRPTWPSVRPQMEQAMCHPGPPMVTSIGNPMLPDPYFRAYGYGPPLLQMMPQVSQNSSYKSSGGEATYQSSSQSSGKKR